MADTGPALQLFGVVDADEAHANLRIGGTSLVTFRDLAAVVAPTVYARVTVDEAVLNEYTRIVDAMYTVGPIVPAPPGTVFKTEAMILQWLELHSAKLHEALGIIERRGAAVAPYDSVRMDFGS